MTSSITPIYLYKCIVPCPKTKLSIKNPIIIWETTINVKVFDTPNPGIALTVKYITRPPSTPPINNLGFICPILNNDFKSPVSKILIKKNIDPTIKLINVATNAVVLFPNSPFTNASKAVDPPANIANNIAPIFDILPLLRPIMLFINFMILSIY